MLETLLELLGLIKTAVYYSLLLSWRTGKIIITTVQLVLSWLSLGAEYLFATVKVFLEDFHPFACDILDHAHMMIKCILFVIDSSLSVVQHLYFAVSGVIKGIVCGVSQTYDALLNIILSVIGTVVEVFAFTKRLLILFGSGVWFLFTLIPLSVVTFFIYSTYCLGLVLEETKNLITTFINKIVTIANNSYDFVIDVPVESLLGLGVAICLIYIFVQFHVELYRFVQHKIRLFSGLMRRNILTFRWTFHRNITQHVHTEEEGDGGASEENVPEEKYCVICQERAKNILLLPCKHVCLCTHCEIRLKNYGYKCPVCRTHVHRTMKVFI